MARECAVASVHFAPLLGRTQQPHDRAIDRVCPSLCAIWLIAARRSNKGNLGAKDTGALSVGAPHVALSSAALSSFVQRASRGSTEAEVSVVAMTAASDMTEDIGRLQYPAGQLPGTAWDDQMF